MRIEFHDDPLQGPRPPDEVRFNQLGIFVQPGGRQIVIGFDITPFFERPSIEVTVTNSEGEVAASLTVIEALHPNFSLTIHLRDEEPTALYEVVANLYYVSLETGAMNVVDKQVRSVDVTQEGEQ